MYLVFCFPCISPCTGYNVDSYEYLKTTIAGLVFRMLGDLYPPCAAFLVPSEDTECLGGIQLCEAIV